MTEQQINQLLNNSIIAALKAGKEILKIYETDDFNVEMKSDNSPLTKADKVAHQTIINELSNPLNPLNPPNSFPIPVLSEEGKNIPYEERKNWERYWLIDPLDGTKEFIKRNGEFTVNIALIENNEPVLGVIYAPAYKANGEGQKAKAIESNLGKSKESKNSLILSDSERNPDALRFLHPDVLNRDYRDVHKLFAKSAKFQGTLYFASTTLGAFKVFYVNDELILQKINSNSKLRIQHSTSVAVGSRSHSSEEEKTKLEELGVTETISVGSSLKFCMVAEGQAQVYYRHGPTMEWDVAAGYAIAKESGAAITGLQFNKENLLNGSFLVKAVSV